MQRLMWQKYGGDSIGANANGNMNLNANANVNVNANAANEIGPYTDWCEFECHRALTSCHKSGAKKDTPLAFASGYRMTNIVSGES